MKIKRLIIQEPIVERGVDLDAYPDTYLAARKKAVDKNRTYANLFKEIMKQLKDMSWKDIAFVDGPNSGGYNYQFILLPEAIRENIKALERLDASRAKAAFKKGGFSFLKTFDTAAPDTGSHIHMKVESPGSGQRSHFPNNGIPDELRGANLGYKLYRALLQKFKYLKSNTGGTTEKDYAWQSVISTKKDAAGALTEDDVHTIVGKSSVLAMIKSLPDAEKIRIAKAFISSDIDKANITTRNLAIDPELKAILPADLKAELDPAQRERLAAERAEADRVARKAREAEAIRNAGNRFELYAPYGVDAHDWEIGDYVVIRSYLMDTTYQNLPVRKVVEKRGTSWIALKISDLAQYEETGATPDIRETTRKTDWVKTKLTRGQSGYMVDPTAGRLAVKGGGTATARPTATPTANATQDQAAEQTPQQRRLVKNFMRGGEFNVCIKEDEWLTRFATARRKKPITTYIVKKIGSGRSATYKVMDARTGQLQNNIVAADYENLHLKKFDITQLERKSGVSEGDWVFVKDHRSAQGYACVVHRITPASNRQPGLYIWTGEDRPQYIGQPSMLWKLTPSANESLHTSIGRFQDLFEAESFSANKEDEILDEIGEDIVYMLDDADIKSEYDIKQGTLIVTVGGVDHTITKHGNGFVIAMEHNPDETVASKDALYSWWSQFVGSHKAGEEEYRRDGMQDR